MKKKILAGVLVILCIVAAVFGYYLYRMWPMLSTTMGSVELTEEHQSHEVDEADGDSSTVYMTTDIFPEGLMRAYEALGVTLNGASLVNRMESRNAEHVLEHGEEVGLGNRSYELVSIDE